MSEQRIVVEARRIWWCEEHQVSRWSDRACFVGANNALGGEAPGCRMVELQLAPLAALIINREELPDMEKLRVGVDVWSTVGPGVPGELKAVVDAARWVLSLGSE